MIKPINDWVFVKRDADIIGAGDIVASDKAHAKNQFATVVVSASDQFSDGDRVILPCYSGAFVDVVRDGVEYVALKGKLIIGIFKGGDVRPVNGYIRIRKCENDHLRDESGAINWFLTENGIEETQWVEILDYAEDVDTYPRECIGWFSIAPELDESLQRIGYSRDYMLKAEELQFITDGE